MRKFFLFFILIMFLFNFIYSADENIGDTQKNEKKQTVKIIIENKTVYNILEHADIASNILLLWGAISTGTGILLLNGNDELLKSLGIQNTLWGALEIGTAMWVKGLIEGKKESGFDEKGEKQKFQDLLGLKFFIDLGFIGIGSAMYMWGNEQIKGHGAGIVIQGFSLAIFDGLNFLISKNLSERFAE